MIPPLEKAKTLRLEFGALAEPLYKQLAGHGFNNKRLAKWQREADAITQLSISGLLRDPEKTRARERLMRTILSAVRDQCAQP